MKNYFIVSKQSFFSSLQKIIKIEWSALKTNPQILYSSLLTPILYFVFYILALNGLIGEVTYANQKMNYLVYAFPGIIAIVVFKEMMTCVYRVIIDRRSKLLLYKLHSGISITAYMLGMAFIPCVGMLVQVLLLAGLLYMLGVFIPLITLFFILILCIFAELFWCIIAIMIAFSTKSYKMRDFILGTVMIPIMYAAPVFSVLEQTPLFIKIISLCNPLTYQANAMRDILIGRYNANIIITAVLSIIAFIALEIMINFIDLNTTERL